MTRHSRMTLAVAALVLATVPATTAAAGSKAARKVTLQVTPRTIVYGDKPVVLTGIVPSRRAGEQVSILSHVPCRFRHAAEIATVQTGPGGSFRYRIRPTLNTAFQVRTGGTASAKISVGVQPAIALRRLRAGRFQVDVTTTNPLFLDGKRVLFQRLVGRRWVTVKRVVLKKSGPELAITSQSSATFSARVPSGSQVRVFLPLAQAPCYRAAASAPISA